MKLILSILISLLLKTYCSAQTHDDVLQRCTSEFQRGLSDITSDSLIDQKMRDFRGCLIGKSFPTFKATTLNNETYSKEDYANKVVLINLWFTSCTPCIAEIPMLNQLNKEYATENFKLISFARDEKEMLFKFMKNRPIDYDIFPDSKGLIESTFKLSFVYPTNIFLNKKGEIIDVKFGSSFDDDKLKNTKNEFKVIIDNALRE